MRDPHRELPWEIPPPTPHPAQFALPERRLGAGALGDNPLPFSTSLSQRERASGWCPPAQTPELGLRCCRGAAGAVHGARGRRGGPRWPGLQASPAGCPRPPQAASFVLTVSARAHGASPAWSATGPDRRQSGEDEKGRRAVIAPGAEPALGWGCRDGRDPGPAQRAECGRCNPAALPAVRQLCRPLPALLWGPHGNQREPPAQSPHPEPPQPHPGG